YDCPMAQLKYCDKHNQVGFLRKPDESAGFAEIVDFLRGSNLRNKTTIDTIGYTITEASIRDTLQLEDATGITMFPNNELFEGMGQMGYPTDGSFTFWKSFFTPQWRYLVHHLLHCISSKSCGLDQFGSNIATALICLSTVPQLILRIDSLETDLKQTKLRLGNVIVKLVKKVKKLEGLLKKRNVVLSDSEEEELEAQGRKNQDDPLASLVQGLVTPSTTKVDASGEEQVEDISPNTLEAAKTLSRVASLKPKSIDKGRRYKRRKETKGKKVVSSLDFQEEVDTGAEQVNTAEGVNTGSIKLSTVSEQVSTGSTKKSTPSPDKGQRAGKAPMIIEETPKKSKEQILQEEASLAEAIRLDSLQKEEEAKQIHLDSLLAQRIAEEEELNEQQKKRKAQVQFEAQHYTDEDWDLIRAKIEANAELSKSMLGSDLQGEDFAKKMVDLVNQRKKYFAEERARAKRNKPMTQSQLKTYMMNYLKNQGTWKLSQLKNLSFEEVKKEFDKLVKQVESFAPINFEATKASLKRFGEELQTKTSKRLKSDEAKDDEPTKKSGKRRKQMARKGLHKDLDKDDSEDSDEVGEQEESVTGTKTPINPVPVAMKSPSIVTYKIIKQGEKGVYQIVREDGTDIVYINFGAMLKDISRDDLTELYRIVMNRYGMDGPEDELEKVFWKYLKNMFEEPLSTDPIWSALGQQRIISWRYYDSCRVHCLNLESMDIYMLIERTYPLSAEMCKAMLDKKLQGGKPDENCYKMLKMMEKQAVNHGHAPFWEPRTTTPDERLNACRLDVQRKGLQLGTNRNTKTQLRGKTQRQVAETKRNGLGGGGYLRDYVRIVAGMDDGDSNSELLIPTPWSDESKNEKGQKDKGTDVMKDKVSQKNVCEEEVPLNNNIGKQIGDFVDMPSEAVEQGMDANVPDEIDGAKGEQVPNHVVKKGNHEFLVCKAVANPGVNELVDKGRPLKRKRVHAE
ncbi:hypothetical protein Tco_1227117, partial [Tanacetum coccineum]